MQCIGVACTVTVGMRLRSKQRSDTKELLFIIHHWKVYTFDATLYGTGSIRRKKQIIVSYAYIPNIFQLLIGLENNRAYMYCLVKFCD